MDWFGWALRWRVHDLQFRAWLRVTFTPLVNELPCLGGVVQPSTHTHARHTHRRVKTTKTAFTRLFHHFKPLTADADGD